VEHDYDRHHRIDFGDPVSRLLNGIDAPWDDGAHQSIGADEETSPNNEPSILTIIGAGLVPPIIMLIIGYFL